MKNKKENEKWVRKKHRIVKKLKNLLVYVATQRTIVILLLAAQIFLICFMVFRLESFYAPMQIIFSVAAAALAVYIINTKGRYEYKIAWLVPLILFPIFTVAIYFVLSNQFGTRMLQKMYARKCEETKKYLGQDKTVMSELERYDVSVQRYAKYMHDFGGYPIQKHSEVTYFRSGEEKFEVMKEELKKARHYIFIEMFIVDQGSMLDELVEILERKASEGVDVRFIYDGLASQHLLPFNYHKKLTARGIKTVVYQPFVALLSSIQNNRDHRKIIVIDGHTGFTGGDNFADEYVNRIVRFGYWKDTAVMIKGEAVWNLTMMFLQMWEVVNADMKPKDYSLYLPGLHNDELVKSDGYVLVYGDSPIDNEDVGKLTYLNILSTAKDYCYISTPYLILNDELTNALCFAAKRGVDVRIITPGVPDKWYVKVLTISYYAPLIGSGVKIYEYDGFNHAKMFVSDDVKAVVGTINLDYRSLYLHFEDGCFLYRNSAVMDIKNDFLYMFEKKCREISLDDCNKTPKMIKFTGAILKILEPLL